MPHDMLLRLRDFDERRPNIPGEHWLAFAAGVGLWLATRKHPSLPVRVIAGVTGGMLVARAVSGRDIPPALQRLLPYSDR